MPRPRRKVILPDMQDKICAMLAVGGTLSMAAQFTGCHVASIRAELRYNPEFAERLKKAELRSEIGFLKSIHAAANDQQWRAAAWALERLFPDRYAKRPPRTVSLDELTELTKQITEAIVSEVPAKLYRQRLQQRIEELLNTLRASADT
ncbi:MAG: hypothetical protein SGJ20_11490 [Planctomycetota bacterium]|nr:hypothetical protein [Planctomycetota bacterium]